jgi:hypothetical protein
MAINNEGPKFSEDAGLIAQRLRDNASAQGSDDKNQFETIADGLATALTRILGKFGIKIRLRTLGSTGVFKQFDTGGVAGKSVNEAAPSLNVRGGVIASIPTKAGFKMDFSSISKPAIEGYPVVAMSYSSLGNLTPLNTGDNSGRGGIGIG